MKQIFKSITFILFILLTTVMLTNCHSTRKASKVESSGITSSGENFDKFYDKFHKDSLFQISRTRFPLSGMSIDGSHKTKWTKDNLPLMKIKVYDVDTTEYKVSFKKTKKTFTQKVWLENSGFMFECRFELIDNKWYLVYVLDQDL
jgi:hypothetical protein